MPALKIIGFDGLVPRASPTMLSDTQAQQADNVKLYARELRYWRGSTQVYAPATAGIQTIWKYYNASTSVWLTWASDVDVVTSPTADTSDYRIYYTGDSVPKKSNDTLISTGAGDYPRAWYHMGVPAPTAAPTVARVGAGASPEDRVYVYTNVSTFGSLTEESAPSAASAIVQCGTGDSVTVNGFAAAPAAPNYNVTHRRIYRSVSGATTVNYQFVTEIPVATASYSDSLTAAQLGETLPSIGWSEPPTGLKGLCALPGGTLCGFVANEIFFSEPYRPHAWPTAYSLNVPHPIVGLAILGSSVAVMTTRDPYFIHGGIPGAMSMERIPLPEPCVSKASIVTMDQSVMYASPNGLVALSSRSRDVITNALYRRDEWQALTPANFKAVAYDGKYIALYDDSSEGTSFVLSSDDIPALSKLGISASAAHVDSASGKLYYVNPTDNDVYEADSNENNPLIYEWKSKRFTLPQATSFSVLKLDANYNQVSLATAYNAQAAAIAAANASLFATGLLYGALGEAALNVYDVNGSRLTNTPPPASARTVHVSLYGEGGALETTLTLTGWDPVRIPPFKSRQIEVKITGNMDVRSILLATTAAELRQ